VRLWIRPALDPDRTGRLSLEDVERHLRDVLTAARGGTVALAP